MPVFAVVAEIFTTPPEDIEIASVSDAEPIVPASLIMISSANVTIPVDAIVIAVAADATPIVPPSLINISSLKVTIPAEEIVIASFADATPIVPPSLIMKSSAIVSKPTELKDIFSDAASLAPVLKLNFVALLSAAKSPSDIASIPAATNIASVPVPSSGAWKLSAPITSFAAISVSPVCKVNTNGLLSAVAADFKNKPSSGSWVMLTSKSAPNLITELSDFN